MKSNIYEGGDFLLFIIGLCVLVFLFYGDPDVMDMAIDKAKHELRIEAPQQQESGNE